MINLIRKLISSINIKPRKNVSAGATLFSGTMAKDERLLRQTLEQCGDVSFRKFTIPAKDTAVLVVMVGNLIDKAVVNRDIIARLLTFSSENNTSKDLLNQIGVGEVTYYQSVETACNQVLLGKTLILVDGQTEALLCDTRQWPGRQVGEPQQEQIIQGPQESFTENISTNLALIRRRLPTPTLKIELTSIGRRTMNSTALVYVADIADKKVVSEIRERLKSIDIDGIFEPGTIGELITEQAGSIFPLYLTSERPDKVSSSLLEGKVAIMADTSPFAYIIPVSFAEFNQSSDDYYIHPVFSTIFRLLRLLSFMIATTFTAAYVAVITFHYEMLPRDIIVFIAEGVQGVPFPPLIEALLLEVAVELIRETSLRLPRAISGTIGIVGALVLGQAIISARLISPVLLIVVAISFLAGFTIPNYRASLPLRYIRFPMLIAGGFF